MRKLHLTISLIILLFSVTSVICAINDINVLIGDKFIANISVINIIIYSMLIHNEITKK